MTTTSIAIAVAGVVVIVVACGFIAWIAHRLRGGKVASNRTISASAKQAAKLAQSILKGAKSRERYAAKGELIEYVIGGTPKDVTIQSVELELEFTSGDYGLRYVSHEGYRFTFERASE